MLPSSSWTQLIKRIAKEEREASNPCDYRLGIVESVNPLIIRLDQKLKIASGFLVITETIKSKGLKINDNVLMIRQDGGQQYVIIDRVVSI